MQFWLNDAGRQLATFSVEQQGLQVTRASSSSSTSLAVLLKELTCRAPVDIKASLEGEIVFSGNHHGAERAVHTTAETVSRVAGGQAACSICFSADAVLLLGPTIHMVPYIDSARWAFPLAMHAEISALHSSCTAMQEFSAVLACL